MGLLRKIEEMRARAAAARLKKKEEKAPQKTQTKGLWKRWEIWRARIQERLSQSKGKAGGKKQSAEKPVPLDKRQRFLTKLLVNVVFMILVFAVMAALIFKKKNIAVGSWFWVMVALLMMTAVLVLLYVRAGKQIRKRIEQVFAAPVIAKEGYKTDMDRLYELVQKKKSVRLNEVMKTFSIDKKKSEEWAAILEDNNLVTIHYPAFGEQELRIKQT